MQKEKKPMDANQSIYLAWSYNILSFIQLIFADKNDKNAMLQTKS